MRNKDLIQNAKSSGIITFIIVFIIVFIITSFLGLIVYLIFHCLGLWDLGGAEDSDVIEFHAVSLSISTIALIAAAYVTLTSTNKNLRGDVLLKIDQRFGENEIRDAESIIHKLCCENGVKDITYDQQIKAVSKSISTMASEADKAKEFIILINFLDFLETIAYMANQELITVKDVQELLGGTFLYYSKIFESLIEHQRNYLKQPDYYRELKRFIQKLG